MDELHINAPAKVNIALDVVRRQDNGYHQMRMINHSTVLADEIILKNRGDNHIHLTCDMPGVPLDEHNLVMKAARKLAPTNKGVDIHLIKRIPMQAGLAGGSADAAATLIGLNQLWSLGLSKSAILDIALTLGADVPYCCTGGTALVEGIGEVITPLSPLPSLPIVVAKPAIDISTPWAFSQVDAAPSVFHPDIDAAVSKLENSGIEATASLMGNSFEPVIFQKYPAIQKLKDTLYADGAFLAIMSGSGSTVVGYFTDPSAADQAASHLKKTLPNVFTTLIK